MFDVQQTVKDLEASITYLREHGWIQGRNFSRSGDCCAWGAVLMATQDVGKVIHDASRSADVARAFYRANESMELAQYNDVPGRTKEQVIAKLTETLAKLKADPSILTAKKDK
jgi:hypothetical protein